MNKKESSIGVITRFLWFCSGANPDILEQCPRSEHIKFSGVGGTVFFTGLLASLSGGYAFYTVFESYVTAVLFGLLWGLIIFNLDRFIVSTIQKEGGLSRQFTLALPRLLLAIVLAVVISKPLELRIFQGEIQEILTDERTTKIANADQDQLAQIAIHQSGIAELHKRTDASFQKREEDYADYKCECDGTCGTGQTGRGSECERKEQKYLLSNREYLEEKAKNEANIQQIEEQINEFKEAGQQAKKLVEETFATGLVARLSASRKLPWETSFFIFLLIVLIETSPILAKILSPRGPYDDMLKSKEKQFSLAQDQGLKKQQMQLQQELDLQAKLNAAELKHELEDRKQTLKEVTKAKQELVQEQIDAWIAEEKLKKKD